MLICCHQIELAIKKGQTLLLHIVQTVKMKLNQASINKILKDSVEVVVYGLESCKYIDVHDALSALNIKTHIAGEYALPLAIPFIPNRERSQSNTKLIIGEECKHLIVNLIIENNKRVRQGQPIVPLLFCVGIENESRHVELSIDCIITESSLIANKELRRCYRLYAETTPDIQMVAMATFKFVQVKQNPLDKDEYLLEQVPPFWENDYFRQKWQERIADPNRPSQVKARAYPKQHKWKNQLLGAIKLFDQAKAETDRLLFDPQRGLRSRL